MARPEFCRNSVCLALENIPDEVFFTGNDTTECKHCHGACENYSLIVSSSIRFPSISISKCYAPTDLKSKLRETLLNIFAKSLYIYLNK
jgi:hypothetical protein